MYRILIIVFTSLVVGCASNQYLDRAEVGFQMSMVKEKVFVTNPEIGTPYEILKSSEIYELVAESETDTKLTLESTQREYLCGNPLIAAALFFGLIPVSLSDTTYFRYEINDQNGTQKYTHEIPIYTRVSMWEWFFKPFSKSEDELLILGLKQSERELPKNGLRY